MLAEIFLAFGTLFPIVNPISTAFVFNSMTAHHTRERKLTFARHAAITAAVTLLAFLLLGRFIMGFFGITIYAFRVAGGLYLGKVAFEMLSKRFYKGLEEPDDKSDLGIIPLAIPLLSGPGSMAATLVLAESAAGISYLPIAVAILAVCLASYIFLRYAPFLSRAMGETGAHVTERLLGLIVLVIAAQFVFNGISGYVATLGIGG